MNRARQESGKLPKGNRARLNRKDKVNMRMKLGLFNVSSQPLLRVGAGNLPVTCGMKSIGKDCLPMDYPYIFMRRAGEPVITERKHTPKIHVYPLLSLTGDCLNQSARKGYAYDAENLAWQRSRHSSLRR